MIPRRLIRTVFTALHGLRRALWRVTGPGAEGVHAVALTGQGRVVLVRLTYAPGWRLPGGGLRRGEAPVEGMLRELREEIGLFAHGAVDRLDDIRPDSGLAGDRSSLFRVRDVRYRPSRSLEVEDVAEFEPGRLPDDIGDWARAAIRAAAAG